MTIGPWLAVSQDSICDLLPTSAWTTLQADSL
jgi:hypothetical protein